MALENFNELLHKLKVLHERELEGWQEKVLELTNQKCCSDTKRMEELFTKNQQLREQQRVLTENIKQLENRLRAGLCDRCTVTQDVAKRQQQEYESSHIQSLQHISVLANEMAALKKENKNLQDEVKKLRGMIEGRNGHSPKVSTPDVGESPDPAAAGVKPCNEPPIGYAPGQPNVKGDPDQHRSLSADEKLPRHRLSQNWNVQEVYVPANSSPISPGRRVDIITTRPKRSHSIEPMEPLHSPSSAHPPTSPLLLLKGLHLPVGSSSSSSSSLSPAPAWDKKPWGYPPPGPVLFRPKPIKRARLSLPWPLTDHEWPTLAPPTPYIDSNRRPVGKEWHPSENNHELKKRLPGLLPGGVLPLRELVSTVEWKDSAGESKAASLQMKSTPGQDKRSSEDNSADIGEDYPLDLSDHRRFKLVHEPKCPESSPEEDPGEQAAANKSAEIELPPQTSPRCSFSTSSAANGTPSPPGSRVPTSPQQGQGLDAGGQDPQEKDDSSIEEKEPVDLQPSPKGEQKKVPVLTISLRPVVVLESYKHGLETTESCNSETPMACNQEELQEEDSTAPETVQNGRRLRRGQATGRDALLRGKSIIAQSNTDTV